MAAGTPVPSALSVELPSRSFPEADQQTVSVPAESFTVGVCATGSGDGVTRLAETILSEMTARGLPMRKLAVVASACPDNVNSGLKLLEARDPRMQVLIEETRHGKADAINRILGLSNAPLIVFVNSDADPEPGAIERLLGQASQDGRVGAVSAVPVPEGGHGLLSNLVDLMWATHNVCSVALNHMNVANHSSDEMVLFRRSAIGRLPDGLVNDGAYLAVTARRRGYSVKVCQEAHVRIRTPHRIDGLIGQRRRIIFGHNQVWRKTGAIPRTLESTLLFSPTKGTRILVRAIAENPRFILALPAAFVTEICASLLSIVDQIGPTKKHAVWRRFD